MSLFSQFAFNQPTQIGAELVNCLTRDATALTPYLAELSTAHAHTLVTQAACHGVGPLLRNRLIVLGLFDALPAAARDNLDAQYFGNTARAAARYHELGVILDRLAEQQIPVIALKGIFLAKAVYPEPGLRPMSDMDLLFRAEDLEATQTLLFELGYTRDDVDLPIAYFLPYTPHLPPFKRPDSTNIEAHLRIEDARAPFSIDHESLWERARPWSIGGRTLLTLAPEDLLLHLCLHGIYHHNFRVGLYASTDIARVVAVEPLNWDSFVERAREWGASLTAFLGLELARRLAGARIPGAVLAALAPQKPVDAVLDYAERTTLSELPENRGNGNLQNLLYYLHKMDEMNALTGWRTKLGGLLSKAFPERAVLEYYYPRIRGSKWIGVMYGLHWLVLPCRIAHTMAMNWRFRQALRRLRREWYG